MNPRCTEGQNSKEVDSEFTSLEFSTLVHQEGSPQLKLQLTNGNSGKPGVNPRCTLGAPRLGNSKEVNSADKKLLSVLAVSSKNTHIFNHVVLCQSSCHLMSAIGLSW